jgi:hypothetical protein
MLYKNDFMDWMGNAKDCFGGDLLLGFHYVPTLSLQIAFVDSHSISNYDKYYCPFFYLHEYLDVLFLFHDNNM